MDPTDATVEASSTESSGRSAATVGLDHLLRPRSIAVVGAADRRGSIGGEVVRNLQAAGFDGTLSVVRPRGGLVAGVSTCSRVDELPAGVDLAVIAVPAAAVLETTSDCIAAGVRGVVVLSAGFAERGSGGRDRQLALAELCRSGGVRLIGPNSLGVINTDPAVRLHATFAPQRVTSGRIAIASQSGAFGLVAMDGAARRGLGLSAFVSLGNRADVSSVDLLRYWSEDDRTDVIGLYLESLGDARVFAKVARAVAAVKPVVVVKSGRSSAGQRAAASHTGSLIEASDGLTDELLREAGVIRVRTVAEMLDVAAVLSVSGRPRGPRVGVLTNGGGAGVACADEAEALGLELPPLADATRDAITALRPQASTENPVDLVADAAPQDFAAALRIIGMDRSVDAVVAIHVPPVAGVVDDTPARIAAVAAELPVPVVLVPLAQEADPSLATRLAVLATPEDAARALGSIAPYAQRLVSGEDRPALPADADRACAAKVIAQGLERGAGWLAPELANALARSYGIPLVATQLVETPLEVERAARNLGGPVALKGVAPGLTHKTEQGAVRLGLQTPGEARAAADVMGDLLSREGLAVSGFVVQEFIPSGVEILVGALNHATFGPLVLCGAGGVTAEVWADTQTRLAPVGPRTAQEMVAGLRCAALLRGWRGAPAADLPAVEAIVVRMAALVADHPEIAEIECNPVLALPDRAVAVDLRVRLERVQ